MTDDEIERKAIEAALVEWWSNGLNSGGYDNRMRAAIDAYKRERWRLESEAHEARQAHQRELNVLAAASK